MHDTNSKTIQASLMMIMAKQRKVANDLEDQHLKHMHRQTHSKEERWVREKNESVHPQQTNK